MEHKYDVFISYSRKDSRYAKQLTQKLSEWGYSYWIDVNGIESGEQFKQKIISAITNSTVLIFVSSSNSNHSEWTIKEVGFAISKRKKIIPICVDNTPFNDELLFDLQYLDRIDATSMIAYPKGFERLHKALRAYIPQHYAMPLTDTSEHIKHNTFPTFVRGQKLHLFYSIGYLFVSLLLLAGLWSNRDMYSERMQPFHYFICILWLYIVVSAISSFLIFRKSKAGVILYFVSSYMVYLAAFCCWFYMLVSTPPAYFYAAYNEDIRFMCGFSFAVSLLVLLSSWSLTFKTDGTSFCKILGIKDNTNKALIYTNIAISIISLILIVCL